MNDDQPQSVLSAEAVIEKAIAARGDVFPEWRLIAETSPETMAMVTNTGGYLHKYEGVGDAEQQLSVQMRELIATPAICSKSDLRHAPNHVRRMYRLGMTDKVILEGALAFAMVVGWATMLNVSYDHDGEKQRLSLRQAARRWRAQSADPVSRARYWPSAPPRCR